MHMPKYASVYHSVAFSVVFGNCDSRQVTVLNSHLLLINHL